MVLECGLSEEELLDLWVNTDEAWRRVQSAPPGITTSSPAINDNLQRILAIMRGNDLPSLVINGINVECCFGNCPDEDCHGSVDMRHIPTILTSGNCHHEIIDGLNPKKD